MTAQFKAILQDLTSRIHQRKELIQSLAGPACEEPHNDISYLDRTLAYSWIFATDNDLALHDPQLPSSPLPELFKELAQPVYKTWMGKYLDIQDYINYTIPLPHPNETVLDYLRIQIQDIIYDNNYTERKWLSLRSFAHFIRKEKLMFDEREFISSLIPEDAMIFAGTIIRKVPSTQYPIDILSTAHIIQALIYEVLNSRTNKQKISAAQTLAFSWICLTCASAHIITPETTLLDFLQEDVLPPAPPNNDLLLPTHHINIPSLFDERSLPISDILYKFLQAIAALSKKENRQHFLFDLPLRTLRRTFSRAVTTIPNTSKLGHITFLTLLSFPNEVTNHRCQPLKTSK